MRFELIPDLERKNNVIYSRACQTDVVLEEETKRGLGMAETAITTKPSRIQHDRNIRKETVFETVGHSGVRLRIVHLTVENRIFLRRVEKRCRFRGQRVEQTCQQ